MPSQRIRRRIEKCGSTAWAAFALADIVAEAVGRRFRREIAEHPAGPAAPRSIAVLFRALGRAIVRRCERVLAADRAYDHARAELRARRQHRDRLAAWLYGRLVELRRRFGKHARRYLGLDGATSRDPVELGLQGFQALRLLRRPRRLPADLLPGGPIDRESTAAELEPLCAELEEAIRAVYRGQASVDAALCEQRRAMADLDGTYGDGSRLMETTLDAIGLPTVRDLIRPGVGRRGRPPKVKPADAYPDLVALALARCAPEVEETAAEAPAADPAVEKGVRSPEEGESVAEGEVGKHPEGSGGVLRVDAALAAGSEKSEQGLRKLPAGGEKIDQDVRTSLAGGGKIDRAVRKLPAGGEKTDHGVHKSREDGINSVFPILTLPPAVRGCDRGRRGPGFGEGWRRQTAPRQKESSTLGRVRQAASAWWRRLKRAAGGVSSPVRTNPPKANRWLPEVIRGAKDRTSTSW